MGYKGKFGTAVERFKVIDESIEIPGPGHYTVNEISTDKGVCDNSYFRSTTTRNCFGVADSKLITHQIILLYCFFNNYYLFTLLYFFARRNSF